MFGRRCGFMEFQFIVQAISIEGSITLNATSYLVGSPDVRVLLEQCRLGCRSRHPLPPIVDLIVDCDSVQLHRTMTGRVADLYVDLLECSSKLQIGKKKKENSDSNMVEVRRGFARSIVWGTADPSLLMDRVRRIDHVGYCRFGSTRGSSLLD